jgi:hypothetical protein
MSKSWRIIGCTVGLLLSAVGLKAAQAGEDVATATRDMLVYKDGDRLLGKMIERVGDKIVFQSDRFGELRVASADAVVIPAEKPAAPSVAAAPAVPAPVATRKEVKEKEEQERVSFWERLSPFVLTAKVRRFFGPWHGKFGVTAESVSDTSDRDNRGIDGRFQRKWERDEVQINGRYTYNQTNSLTTTDLLKSDSFWRHQFPDRKYFAAYRPTLEWNRAYVRNKLPADYLLVQQELGAGVNLYKTPAYQVRVGISENVFTNWVLATDKRVTTNVESGFFEADAKLPWRMTLSDRSVYYYSFDTGKDGFENKLELDKKFTETLSVGLRYEVRYNNPDVRSQDYNLLRLVIGFDF